MLLDITNRIVTKLELRDLLREIATSIRQFMQYDSVGVALPDPEDGELRRYAGDHAGYEEMSVGPASEQAKTVFRTGTSGWHRINSAMREASYREARLSLRVTGRE